MRFFSSDWHFGHENIIKYCNRPFTDKEHMNDALIELWNDTVTEDDEVIFVGDFSLGRQYIDIVPQLKGEIILVAGNHDKIWKKGRFVESRIEEYKECGFSEVYTAMRMIIGNRTVNVSHFPYYTDERHGDRYAEYAPLDTGDWLICGHVHDSWRVSGRQINVGIDANGGRFLTDNDIIEIMSGGTDRHLDALRWEN